MLEACVDVAMAMAASLHTLALTLMNVLVLFDDSKGPVLQEFTSFLRVSVVVFVADKQLVMTAFPWHSYNYGVMPTTRVVELHLHACRELDLSYIIKPIAAPVSIRLVRDKFTQLSKGMAFASFATVEDAKAVLLALNDTTHSFCAKSLSVAYARGRFQRNGPAASASDAVAAALAMNSTYNSWQPPSAPDAGASDAGGGEEWQPVEFGAVIATLGDGTGDAGAPDGSSGQADYSAVAGTSSGLGVDDAAATAPGDEHTAGFVYDAASGYYYDAVSGYYYDANTQLYYHPTTNHWYHCNAETGQYEVVPNTDDSTEASNKLNAGVAADGSSHTAEPTVVAASNAVTAVPSGAVKKKPARQNAILGASPKVNTKALQAVNAAQAKLGTSAPAVAAASLHDSSAVDAWLQRKSAQQVKKPLATAATSKAAVVVKPSPAVKPQVTPVPAAIQVNTVAAAGGVRIREKVYGAAANTTAVVAPGVVQGKIYQGKYS